MSDPTNPASKTGKKPGRRGKILLFASLALNLLVAGLVAGAMVGGPRDRDRNLELKDLGLGPFATALPREDKNAIREVMRKEEGSFRENRAKIRGQFQTILTALRATPYDAQAVEQLVFEQQARISERQALGQRILLDRIAAMSPEQRVVYADALAETIKRGKKPKR